MTIFSRTACLFLPLSAEPGLLFSGHLHTGLVC